MRIIFKLTNSTKVFIEEIRVKTANKIPVEIFIRKGFSKKYL
ncbi:hypothetical protein [endosymbiont 'TC1' of Trimyema compressum]|nr:hypothetical protein [endosymbiont 'TC1' of Trimyema compressum]